ncbi:hypothetical protein ScPMuIL_003039 [Solemya velum]
MSACLEFTHNAWRRGLCANCQRPSGEHTGTQKVQTSLDKVSPVPAKRNSAIIRSASMPPTQEEETHSNANPMSRSALNNGNQLQSERKISTRGGVITENGKDIGQKKKLKSSLAMKKETTRFVNVVFTDKAPSIIGYDGGEDNMFIDPDDESLSDSVSSGEELSFTEEEKEFVLLALENTLWNSDVRNLQLNSGVEQNRKISHEFEDVDFQSLWKADRFATLRDCDACHLSRRYGTFPLRSKGNKVRVKQITRTSSDIELNKISEDPSENLETESGSGSGSGSGSDHFKPGTAHSSLSSTTSLSSEGEHHSATKTASCDNKNDDKKESQATGIKIGDDWPESDGEDTETDPFEDVKEIDLDSSSAGMALVDLINDVLSRYTDSETLKKIETFELEPDDTKVLDDKGEGDDQDDSSVKSNKLKSKAFEAKMASLAANLDLSKQRPKRPAPRPPSSPPVEPITPKQSPVHLPEPNFKMAPLGKFGGPHFERPSSPEPSTSTCTRVSSSDDHNNENMDGFRVKTENKTKKGLTSFFRNILRRGRDSVEVTTENTASTESLQPKNGESSKVKTLSTSGSDSVLESEEFSPEKQNSKFSPQLKMKVLPPVSKPPRTSVVTGFPTSEPPKTKASEVDSVDSPKKSPSVSEKSNSDTIDSNYGDVSSEGKTTATMTSSQKIEIVAGKDQPGSSSPAPKHKEILGTPPKPPIAAKPRASPQNQAAVSESAKVSPSSSSEDGRRASPENRTRKTHKEEIVVRRRAKSPKRIAAPTAPVRQSMPCKATEQRNPFTKELEMKLSKTVDPNKTPSKKADTKKTVAPQPPSPVSPKEETEEMDKFPSTSTEDLADMGQEQRMVEKIELPKAAQSRRSFLGKLGGNRKSRPPPPPSVKRTKSITESSLPASELHAKKIDVKDISGPVLIANMSSGRVVHRRNTITLGDDCAFMSGGSTSSGSMADRSDEPQDLSPLSSLENLYEAIIPKSQSQAELKPNYYDPIDSRANQPSKMVPIEGYLEPVRMHCSTDMQSSVISNSEIPKASTPLPTEDATAGSAEAQEEAVTHELVLDEARRRLLASQPIYEEINGYCKESNAPISPTMKLSISTIDTSCENILPDMPSPIPSPRSKDSQMSESESSSSATSTLSRPRPAPRRKAKKGEVIGVEQYVAMNRPSLAVTLNEDQLREMINKLTSMNLQTLRELYTLHERALAKENLKLITSGPLKFVDFDIYGKPVHTSERCVVYNARLKISSMPCQLLLLHTRPEITSAHHPSLLRPTVVFTDNIPFSYLHEDFIKTSQLLQNSVAQSNIAKCYIAVGLFDIADSMSNTLNNTREENETKGGDYIELVLLIVLQLLSAVSHCFDQGYVLVEADFRDTFVILSNSCSGHIVAFLPHQRSHENSQAAIVCNFLEKFLQDFVLSVFSDETPGVLQLSGVTKIISLLQPMKMESLAAVRTYIEHLLWGPKEGQRDFQFGSEDQSRLEIKLSMWLEKERATLIHKFSKLTPGTSRTSSIQEFYQMKFLLKSSSVTLTDCITNHFST